MSLTLPRRRFIAGLASILAAPAIVKAERLMKLPAPKRVMTPAEWFERHRIMVPPDAITWHAMPPGLRVPTFYLELVSGLDSNFTFGQPQPAQ